MVIGSIKRIKLPIQYVFLINFLARVEEAPANYASIDKYTFYDNEDMWVKVLLDLPKIGEVEKSNMKAEFLPRSFAFKINGYEGKNRIFRVPRLHFKINPEKSKFVLKPNKIIISLYKHKENDQWFTLFKKKMVGEIPSDDEC